MLSIWTQHYHPLSIHLDTPTLMCPMNSEAHEAPWLRLDDIGYTATYVLSVIGQRPSAEGSLFWASPHPRDRGDWNIGLIWNNDG